MPLVMDAPYSTPDDGRGTNLSTTVLTAKSSGPGAVFSTRDLHASLAGSLSVGAGRAQGQGFDVEEYAERIYRANINLGLAEVPRDYFDSAQAPDF